MSTVVKIILGILLLGIVAFGVSFLVSRYLVSKLDGTGGVVAPQETTLQYTAEEGVTFRYPDTYEVSSHTEGNAERQWDTLVLLPKGYVPPQGGEGPATIALSIFDNRENLPLDQWVTSDARSNWKLAVQDGGLGSVTVGGKPGLRYHYSGLYETSAVAVAHNGKVFLFTGSWMDAEDPIRAEFEALLLTVSFL